MKVTKKDKNKKQLMVVVTGNKTPVGTESNPKLWYHWQVLAAERGEREMGRERWGGGKLNTLQ